VCVIGSSKNRDFLLSRNRENKIRTIRESALLRKVEIAISR
jgi:hypothetical protein